MGEAVDFLPFYIVDSIDAPDFQAYFFGKGRLDLGLNLKKLAGNRRDDFAVNDDPEAGFAGISASDEKIQVIAFYDRLWGGHYAFSRVAAVISVHEALAFETFDLGLVAQRTMSGAGAEGLAGYGPVAVILALEIVDHNVIAGFGGDRGQTNNKYGRHTQKVCAIHICARFAVSGQR